MESKIIITPESIVTILETMLHYQQLLEDNSRSHVGLCLVYRKAIIRVFYSEKPLGPKEAYDTKVDVMEFVLKCPFWHLTPHLSREIAAKLFKARPDNHYWWGPFNFKSRRAFLEFALKKARKDIHLKHNSLMVKKMKSFIRNLFNKLK